MSSSRASQTQDRPRLSDVGEYVNAWAARIFSGWVTTYPVICETNNGVQHPKLASQRGQYQEHPIRAPRKKTDSAWTAVMQDMNGEVTAFKDRKDEWRQSQQNHSRDRIARDGDVEMIDVDDEMEHLAEEVLDLRHRYNVLGDSAFAQHPGISVKFFTEEELYRSDLPPPRKTRLHQVTVRDEDEERDRGATRAQIMPGSYPPSPPSKVSPAVHGTDSESGNASAVDIDSKYGLFHVPAKFGQSVTNDTMNESSDSSSESDGFPSEESTDSGSESDDSASRNRDTNIEHDAAGPTLPLQYPELPASPPALYTLPAHLIPAKVTRSHARPIQDPGLSPPPKTSTGTADAFDQRRALLAKPHTIQLPSSKVNTSAASEPPPSSTGGHASSSRARGSSGENNPSSTGNKKVPKAPILPAIPQITIEPPSNSTRSCSLASIDSEMLLPPRPGLTRRQRNGSGGAQKPKNLSSSTITTRATKPSSYASATGTGSASKTTQKLQIPSSIIMSGGLSKLSSTISTKLGTTAKPAQDSRTTFSTNVTIGIAKPSSSSYSNTAGTTSGTTQKPTKPATNNNSTGAAKPSPSKASNGSDHASKLAQKPGSGSIFSKPGSGSGLLGLGNSILGKKKTTSGQSETPQTGAVSHGNQKNTSQGSRDAGNHKKGSHDAEDAIVCPDCTFANPPNAKSCEICKAKFVDMSDSSKTSHLHIPGAFPGSNEGTGDVEMQHDEPALTPVSDEFIVIYKTPASFKPTDPDHYATGGVGSRGTFGPLGTLIPVSDYEASRLAGQREYAPRGPRGAPYFNERIQLTMKEQREYAEIQAWEKRKQERLRQLEHSKWDELSDKEKQALSQKQEQERQIQLQLKAAADAEASFGSGFLQMLGFG